MRLINSDVFKEKLYYLNYELYNSHPVGELSKEEKDTVSWYIHHISKMVDNMPTVNAIPIEWLINKCNEADNMGMGIDDWSMKDCYQLVLEQWEKENEQNKESTSQAD